MTGEIALAQNEIEDELEQVGADMRRGLLLRYVIDTRLMALAGASAGLDKERAFKRRGPLQSQSGDARHLF